MPAEERPRLVFGASGYIGTYLVPRLLATGVPLRVVSRQPRALESRGWRGWRWSAPTPWTPRVCPPPWRGRHRLLPGALHGRGADFGRLDLEAAANFAQAASEAGVERICYLGGLVPADADSEHIVSRRETGEVLRAGRVPVTEIRAGIIVGPGSAAFEVMRDLVYHLPVMVTPRWVRAKSPPIALDNLLTTWCGRQPSRRPPAGYLRRGRPRDLTYEAMMRILAEAAGRRPPGSSRCRCSRRGCRPTGCAS
jgi:uncharacterized protein YbjT (DUF2867 family)